MAGFLKASSHVRAMYLFPRETYHTIVPSTEELFCLNRNSKFSMSYFLKETL